MATITQREPSPLPFFQAMNAFQQTAALRAAIELDLFTAIDEGYADTNSLARRCEASERGTRILCDALVVMGFLTKPNGQYGLTLDSSIFLSRKSRAYVGSAVEFLNSSMLTDAFRDFTSAVRTGGTTMNGTGTLEAENPIWVKFARAMAPLMVMPAEMIAKLVGANPGGKWKVLDIAAGHGTFGITIARQNPEAEIYALDWANVLEVAKENAKAAGVADRYQTISGSAFEADFGTDYDLVLLTNFLHHFDPPTCERLLRKVHAALKTGGRAVTLEFVPNEDRVSPAPAALFSLTMLGTTPSGDAYTFSQLDKMLGNAGFLRTECHQTPTQSILISHK